MATQKMQSGEYRQLSPLVEPPLDFIRNAPLFGVHGIKPDNLAGFMAEYNRGIGNGHFLCVGESDRALASREFAIRLRCSLERTIGFSCSDIPIGLDEAGQITSCGRPTVILAIERSRQDSRINEREEQTGQRPSSEFISSDGAFIQLHGKTFDGVHGVIKDLQDVAVVSFDLDDERQLKLAWSGFMAEKGISPDGIGIKQVATEFSFYYYYLRIADKVVRKLEQVIELRGTRLPETKDLSK
jgi:hypothetical protein